MEAHVVLALKWLYKPAIPNDVMLGNRELAACLLTPRNPKEPQGTPRNPREPQGYFKYIPFNLLSTVNWSECIF